MQYLEALEAVEEASLAIWAHCRRMYGDRMPKAIPTIVLSNRLKTTAGIAWLDRTPQEVHLSYELLLQYPDEMIREILPHEIAHLVAFSAWGDKGHGQHWAEVMHYLGRKPERLHHLVNMLHIARKRNNAKKR
jgi:SprT protein